MTRFLDLDSALELHRRSLAAYGGLPGIRDHGGLESALAQAQAGFGDEEFHPTIFDKAAAYLYHLATIPSSTVTSGWQPRQRWSSWR
jgi:death-on-curing protein